MRMQGKTKHIYAEAERDIQKKLDDFLARFKAEDERRKKLVDAGEMSKAEYDSWRRGQVFRGKRWQALRDEIVDQIYGSNKTAARIMNDERRSVFIQNANRTAYELEKKTNGAVSFELYDSATVTRLMKKDRKLLPYAEIKKMKDGKYNRKKVNNALTQSIIQGESMDKLARRIAEAVGSKNASLMYSFARTMMTGAQNAGRLEAMREARDMGIKVKKRWLATLDSHTRDTHRDLDGVSVDVDKPFIINGRKIMFPGDPHADADLVSNCRCTLIYDYEDYPANIQRRDNETGEVIDYMTYREWEKSKQAEKPNEPQRVAKAESYADKIEFSEVFNDEQQSAIKSTLIKLESEYPLEHKFDFVGDGRISRGLPHEEFLDLVTDHPEINVGEAAQYVSIQKHDGSIERRIDILKEGDATPTSLKDSMKYRANLRKEIEDNIMNGDGRMSFYFASDGLEGTLIHEYAHALQDNFGFFIRETPKGRDFIDWLKEYWRTHKKECLTISQYAASNYSEMFAEAFVTIHDTFSTDSIAYKTSKEIIDEFRRRFIR